MRMNFILPDVSQKPIGGYKLIYQYANFFVQHGHSVTIYHEMDDNKSAIINFFRSIKRKLDWKRHKLSIDWFRLDNRVVLVSGVYRATQVRDADVTVATAISTAIFTNNLREETGNKFYFIQNYENWGGYSSEMVNDSYRLPMIKIVISSWLADFVEQATGSRPAIVPNFVSKDNFFDSHIFQSRNNVVSLLNHTQITKRTQLGLAILREVRKKIPDLKVQLFGTYAKPKDLPKWVEYHFQPSQDVLRNEIYGQSKVYLMPSVLEGWGLTGMEAMACGAVPVAAKYGGMVDFMTDEKNAFLVEKDNKIEFVEAIVKLLRDDNKWDRMSSSAVKITNRFSIEKSATKLLELFSR